MGMFIGKAIGHHVAEGITGMHQVTGNREEQDGFGYTATGKFSTNN